MTPQNKAQEEGLGAVLVIGGIALAILLLPVLLTGVVTGYLFYWLWHTSDDRRYLRILAGVLGIAGMLTAFWKFVFMFFQNGIFAVVSWFNPNVAKNALDLSVKAGPTLVIAPLIVGLAVALSLQFFKFSPKEKPYVWLRDLILIWLRPATWAVGVYLRFPKEKLFIHLIAFFCAMFVFHLPNAVISGASLFVKERGALNAISFTYYILAIYTIVNPFRTKSDKNQEFNRIKNLEDGIHIGRIVKPFRGTLKLQWKDINHHIHILGQPGSGKSVLLRNIYAHQILSGAGMLMIDLKADLDVKSEIKGLIKASNREKDLAIIDLSDPERSLGYNPLLRGNPSELKDKIMGSLEWSESYYKKVSERYLLHIFNALVIVRDQLKLTPTLSDVHACLSSAEALEDLADRIEKLNPGIAKDLTQISNELRDKSKSAFSDLTGLRTDIEVMIKSAIGPILEKSATVDILEAIKSKKVILVNLDGQTYNETAKRFGRMLIADLRSASGHIVTNFDKSNRPKFTVIVDEFADIISNEEMAESFVGFLNRCRGSGIGVIIAHQSLGDFKEERSRKQVLDSTETTISFVQKDPESCELLANIIGTQETVMVTEQTDKFLWWDVKTGMGTEKVTQEFIFHPNEFKELDVGEAIFSAKRPSRHGKVKVAQLAVPMFNGELGSQSDESTFSVFGDGVTDAGTRYASKLRKAAEEADI